MWFKFFFYISNFTDLFDFYFSLSWTHHHNSKQKKKIQTKLEWKSLNQGEIQTTMYTIHQTITYFEPMQYFLMFSDVSMKTEGGSAR